ncbi:MAG: hypothetical protein ABIS67_14985 [Candidatus Eisenbacteria bacterium]
MISRRLGHLLRAVAIGLLFAAGAGCGRSERLILGAKANLRPVLELTRAPQNESTRFEYSYRMSWLGHDPDGRVDHYLYTVDPPAPTPERPLPETTWVSTNRNERLVNFSATRPDTIRPNEHGSSDFHTFVVKAIDNGGHGGALQSVPLVRSFYTYTIAPTVQIVNPPPSDRGRTYVAPSVRISWTGSDEDGILNNRKPNQYKFILLTQNTPVPFQVALTNPDSVRRFYAPRRWAGWDSTTADTTTRQFSHLVPGQDYMFCVIAFDEAGAYSPIFSQNMNMLNMRVTYATQGGPRLTVWNEIFFYQYNPPVHSPLPQYQIKIEVPANQEISFNWIGEAWSGAAVRGYRWALDIEDLTDQTPRSNERTDVARWSQWSSLSTRATVGPFAGDESHLFYIQAEDDNDLKSLATVNLTVVQSSFAKPLLIVNDTRLSVDQKSVASPCMDRPRSRWPMAAELDTFLFARGGFPWRCYPEGVTTTPGIFAGYEFDTLGTRTGQSEVRVSLAKLGGYRHVIWLTDSNGGINVGHGTSVAGSIGALRYMSVAGRANSIAAYIQQGGEVWLAGGGAAFASLIPFNRLNNDITSPAPGTTFSFLNNELIPGRFLHDIFRWQSEIKVNYSQATVTRYLGRHDSTGGTPAAYRRLPTQLRPKNAGFGDAFPPHRTFNQGDFYLVNFDVEYLSQANRILEDVDPSLLGLDEQSTLDTLYRATGNAFMPPQFNRYNVCMTRYVGLASTPVIFSGFGLWTWTRADAKSIVDAVLQDFWGFPAAAPARGSSALAAAKRQRRTPED